MDFGTLAVNETRIKNFTLRNTNPIDVSVVSMIGRDNYCCFILIW